MNRRQFLQMASLAGVGLMVPFGRRALRADTPKRYGGPYLLMVHASGGWDPTFLCDPKGDPVDRLYKRTDIGSAGALRYAPIQYLDGNGQAVYTNEQFFSKHGSRLLVINGIDTTTANHDTGTRATWSGRTTEGYPTFAALAAAAKTPDNALGFLSNGGYEYTAGLIALSRVGNADLVRRVAYPNLIDTNNPDYFYTSPATQERIARTLRERLDDRRHTASLPRLQRAASALYVARNGDNDLSKLAEALPTQDTLNNIGNDLARQATVALAGFKSGLAVAANLVVGGFDTHGDHDNQQRGALYGLLTGLDQILAAIDQQGLTDQVIVVVGSDFGRTPTYNTNAGKDHWNITSMMAIGPGIAGGRVVGGTDDEFKAWTVNPATLQQDPSGTRIRCDHVHLALRKLVGIDGSAPAKAFPLAAESMPIFTG